MKYYDKNECKRILGISALELNALLLLGRMGSSSGIKCSSNGLVNFSELLRYASDHKNRVTAENVIKSVYSVKDKGILYR